MPLTALAAAFPDGRHTIERLTPVGTDEALLYRRFTGTAFLGAVTAVPAWTLPAPACSPLAAEPSPHTATSKTCSPSPADRARTTPDHDRVTDAGQQAAAASRTSIRPPLP